MKVIRAVVWAILYIMCNAEYVFYESLMQNSNNNYISRTTLLNIYYKHLSYIYCPVTLFSIVPNACFAGDEI